MIRRRIPGLRKVIRRAETIKRAKVAWAGTSNLRTHGSLWSTDWRGGSRATPTGASSAFSNSSPESLPACRPTR
jgi:hypothetical protein